MTSVFPGRVDQTKWLRYVLQANSTADKSWKLGDGILSELTHSNMLGQNHDPERKSSLQI